VRKQYIGTIVRVGQTTLTLQLPGATGGQVCLDAGAAVLEQARMMGPGRVVRFSAELDDRTECLSKPRFVVSSQVGLQAVQVTDAL
jgi:hypothetical protein